MGRMIGSRRILMKCTTPKPKNSSAMIKKGSNEGNTIVHHVVNPIEAASKVSLGNISIEMQRITAARGRRIFMAITFNEEYSALKYILAHLYL